MDFCRSFRLLLVVALLPLCVAVFGKEAVAIPGTADPVLGQATSALAVSKPLPPALANPRPETSTVVLDIDSEAQTTFPAVGLCPVITDYLYDLCQQNPDDPSCLPNN